MYYDFKIVVVELPVHKNRKLIESGEFEFETYLSKEELVKFLRNLADQIEKGNEIEVSSEDWVIRFTFTEPIEVEVEFDAEAKKLEFEIEFRQRSKIVTG